MAAVESRWTDERVEAIMGNLLRAGVMLAAAVVFVGGVVYLIHHGTETPNYAQFHRDEGTADFRHIARGVADFRGRQFIQLGILILLATPVARVAFSVAAFAIQRDWFYVLVTLIVLAALLYSLFLDEALRPVLVEMVNGGWERLSRLIRG